MSAPHTHQTQNAAIIQETTPVTTIVRDVQLVEEKIHQREEQHVQPILERDIHQKEVRQVLQPMHETTVLPTQHATGVLAGQDRLINNDAAVAPILVPEAARIVGATDVNVIQHAPIVEERFHKQVIEEVQPVLYRDVIQNKETIITQQINERIIDAPIVIQETRPMMEVGHTRVVEPVAVQPVREVIAEPVVVERVAVVEPVAVVAPVVPVAAPVHAPVAAPATAAFAVVPDGVPVVHDGKIVNAGLGGHDAGQTIRPVEAGLQTHGANYGTGAGVGSSFPKKAKGTETAEEKKARKAAAREAKKHETAERKAERQAAKEAKRREKRPHETKEERKARKAAAKEAKHHHA